MSKYKFNTQADKDAAIAVQTASHNETAEVHAKHLADLEAAEVVE